MKQATITDTRTLRVSLPEFWNWRAGDEVELAHQVFRISEIDWSLAREADPELDIVAGDMAPSITLEWLRSQ